MERQRPLCPVPALHTLRWEVNVRWAGFAAFVALALSSRIAAAQEWPVGPDARLEGVILGEDARAAEGGGWDPREMREELEDKLLSLLPGGVLGDVARTFADQTLQLDLSPKRAFLRLRLPL